MNRHRKFKLKLIVFIGLGLIGSGELSATDLDLLSSSFDLRLPFFKV